jgi:hypothetical protein
MVDPAVPVREFIERVMDERDRLYDTRFAASKTAVDAALAAQEKATNAAFLASEKAITKADVNAEKWRENANEWRASMLDREIKFASKAEMEAELKAIRSEISGLRESRAQSAGHTGGATALWGYVVGACGLLLTLLTIGALIARFKG